MPTVENIYFDVLRGTKDRNIRFRDLQRLLIAMGFSYHVKGDHFIYTKIDVAEIVNIQPDGNKAKPYQVKQVRNLILKYHLEVSGK